ncbi:Vps51/Vps67-domain-containing protein [Lanmaoa asiatica]|nr:Vps51/Vps67-domain-containing protein [Lanmaoa asiatica]
MSRSHRVGTRDRDIIIVGIKSAYLLFLARMSSPTKQRRQSTQRAVSSPLRSMSPPASFPHRPSSGLGQSTSQGTLTPPGPATKTRAMDLLRKHYGLGVGPPLPIPGKSNDPMNMGMSTRHLTPFGIDVVVSDSPAFDAKTYYDQLITTSSLPALLKRENELLTGGPSVLYGGEILRLQKEIRQLDSERQSLVYGHHHELIAASDTIATMKNRAESLDADLDSLKAAFSEISRLAAEVSIERQSSSNAVVEI